MPRKSIKKCDSEKRRLVHKLATHNEYYENLSDNKKSEDERLIELVERGVWLVVLLCHRIGL